MGDVIGWAMVVILMAAVGGGCYRVGYPLGWAIFYGVVFPWGLVALGSHALDRYRDWQEHT